MSSKKPKPYLIVLDVGHGNAAVLNDEGGTVVFDTGKGAGVAIYLSNQGIQRVHSLLLSHADVDHIGGSVTLLLNKSLRIDEVLLNSDASKESDKFEQLRYALAEANARDGTRIERRLTTSTKIKRKGASIEVLHPPDVIALAGVGGKSTSGKRLTSNSMSAAIRVSRSPRSSILMGGDIEYDCVDGWKRSGLNPSATVLVFPHHGGLPESSDESEAKLFGYEITKLVNPDVVIFSNHRTKHGNPRECILNAIAKAVRGIRFVCTQLPQHFHSQVNASGCWSLHKPKKGTGIIEGSICLVFRPSGIEIGFGECP
jgi:beta-lactamase superfamily II metal-dependent hydrolase